MKIALIIYLLVYGNSFSPLSPGFGNYEYYTSTSIKDIAIKVYENRNSEISPMRLFKITLLSEDIFLEYKSTSDIQISCLLTSEYKQEIEEFELPILVLEETKERGHERKE